MLYMLIINGRIRGYVTALHYDGALALAEEQAIEDLQAGRIPVVDGETPVILVDVAPIVYADTNGRAPA